MIAVDYYGDTPANWADSIVIDRCVLTPGTESGSSPFRTSSVGINAAGTNWTLTNSYIYNIEGSHSQAATATVTAATNASPSVFSSTYGAQYGYQYSAYIDGATGNWAKINGFVYASSIDGTKFTPGRWIAVITKTTGVATVTFLWNRPHNFLLGDSIYISGITDVAGTSLNGTKTITGVPNSYTFTYADATATNNSYCSYSGNAGNANCFSNANDNMTAAIDATTFGALTGTVRVRAEVPTNSLGVALGSSPGPYKIVNNYIAAWFSEIMSGGGAMPPKYTATISSVSAGGATFSNVTGLRAQEVIAITSSYTGFVSGYRVVQVQSIVGNVVTWKGIGPTRLANAASDYDTGTCDTSGTAVTIHGMAVPPNPWNVYYAGVPITINGVDYVMAADVDGSHVTLTGSAGTQTGVACHLNMLPTEGGSAYWRGSPGPILEVRSNTMYKSDTGYVNSRLCKGMNELKLWNGGIFDGNIHAGFPCITLALTIHNQEGDGPWSSMRNWTFSNNLALNTERTSTLNAMTDYFATTVWGPDLPAGFEYGSTPGAVNNNLFLDDVWATDGYDGFNLSSTQSVWTHNTQKRLEPHTQDTIAGMTTYPVTNTLPFRYSDPTFKDNIASQGSYNSDTSNWQNWATKFVSNVFVDDFSTGYHQPNNTLVANWAALGFPGTCNTTGSNWLNCVATNYVGTASDGGTPGADVKQINDHINMWSETAGLISFYATTAGGGYQNVAGAFASTGATESITWTRVNGSGHGTCALHLFTNLSRTVEHADTTGGSNYDCTRTGNTNPGQSTTFVLGTHAVLTPLTTYYYEITDGSNLMPGSFATSALTSPGGTRFSGAVGLSGKVGTQ